MSDKKVYPSQQQERFLLRMPDGMRDAIAAFAKDNNRSMNAEIIDRLEMSLEDDLAMKYLGMAPTRRQDIPKIAEAAVSLTSVIKEILEMQKSLVSMHEELKASRSTEATDNLLAAPPKKRSSK